MNAASGHDAAPTSWARDARATANALARFATAHSPADLSSGRESTALPRMGVYAWYFRALPGLSPGVRDHCVRRGPWQLLYVGIAPSRPGSRSTLRRRLRLHVAGNASSSTLRLTLGCLLADSLGLRLQAKRASKRCDWNAGEPGLSAWLATHGRVVVVAHPRPWDVEQAVIGHLRPPLNLAHNLQHPFAQRLSDLRAEHRARAMRKIR